MQTGTLRLVIWCFCLLGSMCRSLRCYTFPWNPRLKLWANKRNINNVLHEERKSGSIQRSVSRGTRTRLLFSRWWWRSFIQVVSHTWFSSAGTKPQPLQQILIIYHSLTFCLCQTDLDEQYFCQWKQQMFSLALDSCQCTVIVKRLWPSSGQQL